MTSGIGTNPEPIPASERSFTALLLLLATATLAAKTFFAWRYPGFSTGDDTEIVETAAKYAVGLDYRPWDLRCLFHPLALVTPVLTAGALLGVRDPRTIGWLAALPTIAFSTASIVLIGRLARRWGFDRATALAAAFFYALSWLPLAFGSTPYPRPISTALLLGSFLLASAPRDGAGPFWAAGALAGAAFAVRWSEGLVLLPLLAWTSWRTRSPRLVAAVGIGFLLSAMLLVGVSDAISWGAPFASLRAFLRQMWFEAPAARAAPLQASGWYARTVLHWAGPIAILLLLPAWKDRRARPAIVLFLSIVLLLSAVAASAKEWRYLQAAIPFLAIGSAAGWERLRAGGHRRLALAALLLSVPYGLERTVHLLENKSQSAIEAARFIAALRPSPRVLALEQPWAYGDRLWLGDRVRIEEIEVDRPVTARAIAGAAAAGADVVGVYTLHIDPARIRQLAALGYRPLASFKRDASSECSLFARGFFAASERGAPAGRALRAATPPPGSGKP